MTAHTASGDASSGTPEREEALVARLAVLAPALDGEPDPGWQARTRDRLVAMAAVRTPEPARPPVLRRLSSRAGGQRGAWRGRLTAGLAGAAAAVTGLAGVVALSADARPGDFLYGVKRGTEQTQLALAGDARGRTLLAFAATRLEELAAVLEDDPSTGLVEDTLALMDAQTADGVADVTRRAVDAGAGAPLDDLAGWAASQSATLGGLLPDVPPGARPEAAASAELLDRVDGRVAELRTSLGCAGGPATDGTDHLGPRAAACAAGPPAADGGGRVPAPEAPGAPEAAEASGAAGAPDAVELPAPSSGAVAPPPLAPGSAVPPPDQPSLDLPAPRLPAPDVHAPSLPAPRLPVPGLPAPRAPAQEPPAPRLPAQELPIQRPPAPDLPAPRAPVPPLPVQEPPALPDPGAVAPPPLGGTRLPAPPPRLGELACGLTQVVTDC